MKNINEDRIEINAEGMCETFKEGVSPIYKGQEDMDNENDNSVATLGYINDGRP